VAAETMGFGNDMGFGIMSTIFPLFFFVVIGFIVFGIVRGIAQWHSNNQHPVLAVDAIVVSKRTDVSHHHHHQGQQVHHSGSTTYYYVTFEVESGDRMEFGMDGQAFGLLAEGDKGKLTFQGTRYLDFQRGYAPAAY
jgi:hypothetical protein